MYSYSSTMLWKCINIFSFVISFVFVVTFLQDIQERHPHVGLDEYQIIKKYGYTYEKHDLTTDDGYILELLHIFPRNRSIQSNSTNPLHEYQVFSHLRSQTFGEPVLLMHGIMADARTFISHDPDKALAFILANHGYDVYLGNARGTTRSRRHLHLDPEKQRKAFWDFTWTEIGVFDQPVMIDYILNQTGYTKLSFVGHSQGGTSYIAMLAGRPEYNSKIKIGFSLGGPTVAIHTPRPRWRWFSSFEPDLQKIKDSYELYEFMRYSLAYDFVCKIIIDEQFGMRGLIDWFMNFTTIITTHNLDIRMIPVLATSMPAGASVNQALHFLQGVNYGDFRHFDYLNKSRNIEKYGSRIPPRFNLTKIACPTILYYSKFDFFIQDKDSYLMAKEMKNATPVEIAVENFSHADFLWATNIVDILFKDLLWRLRNS